MPSNAKQTTASRELKYRFHLRRVYFWNILLFFVNGLFLLTLLFATAPLLILAMLVEEVFIADKPTHRLRLTSQFLMSLILPPAIVSFGWWVLVNVREITNRHTKLAAGYAQESAEEALAKARSEGHHFGLFLRGFEWETVSTTYYGPNPEIGSREAAIYAPEVETLLLEMLNRDVPLVALANPQDLEPMPGVYRFESIPENWEQFVNELLTDAFPIVMHLTSLTTGIRIELSLISLPAYSSKTVIIVSRYLAIRNSSDGEALLKLLFGFNHIVFEQIDEDWSRAREIEFHARLRQTLQALKSDSQAEPYIVSKEVENFTVNTQTRLQRILNFMKGPALGASLLLTPMMLVMLLIGDFDIDNSLLLIGRIFVMLLIFILALSALKGLTYLLGFAQVSGENERFPTFNRMLKWVKKHSVTPKR